MSNVLVIAMPDFGAGRCRKFIVNSNEDGPVFKCHFNRVFHVEHPKILIRGVCRTFLGSGFLRPRFPYWRC